MSGFRNRNCRFKLDRSIVSRSIYQYISPNTFIVAVADATHDLDVGETDQHKVLHYSASQIPPHTTRIRLCPNDLTSHSSRAVGFFYIPGLSVHSHSSHPIPPAPTTSMGVCLTFLNSSGPSSASECPSLDILFSAVYNVVAEG